MVALAHVLVCSPTIDRSRSAATLLWGLPCHSTVTLPTRRSSSIDRVRFRSQVTTAMAAAVAVGMLILNKHCRTSPPTPNRPSHTADLYPHETKARMFVTVTTDGGRDEYCDAPPRDVPA